MTALIPSVIGEVWSSGRRPCGTPAPRLRVTVWQQDVPPDLTLFNRAQLC